MRPGPETRRSVVEVEGGKRALWGAEAEWVPGPIMEIGNPNRRSRFAGGAREFVSRGNAHSPAQPCAVGGGHSTDRLAKFGALPGLAIGRRG